METCSIMVVEDELIISKDIVRILHQEGYDVVAAASSGKEAIERALVFKPDLILMDIKLNGEIDGIQAADEICWRIDVPVIYLSALSDVQTRQRAKNTHVFGFVLKPIEPRELIVSVEMALHKHHLEKELKNQLRRTNSMRLIDQVILNNHDSQQTLRQVLGLVTQQLGVDAGAILIFNPRTNSLSYSATFGLDEELLLESNARLEAGLPAQAIQTGQSVIIEDISVAPVLNIPACIEQEGFTFYIAAPLIIKGQVKGVLEVFNRGSRPVDDDWLDFLQILTNQTAIAVDNSLLLADLINANRELSQAYEATIEGWSTALELRDLETEGHSRRVTEATHKLAFAMGIQGKQLEYIRLGALLHDIGKMGIPDQILLHPGPLSKEEWNVMQRHPAYAYDLLRSIPFLAPALDVPYCHHEKWDGTGYPQGLRGMEIPLAARIFAVVDVWDAMLSNRPYHKPWHEGEVLGYIRSQAGKHFDPAVVEAFIKLRETELKKEEKLS